MEENLNAESKFDVFKRVLQTQYWCFDGRMSKKEYWDFMIPAIIIYCLLIWTCIVPLGLLAPMLGATARRFHDLGKSGWMQLLDLICCVGVFITLYLCLPEGQTEANDYGEVPAK